jgi:transcription elongation factor Elf1
MTEKRRKDAPEKPPRSLECPDCGCEHFEVVWVAHKPRKIIRRKQCRNCGRRIRTIERLDGDAGHDR